MNLVKVMLLFILLPFAILLTALASNASAGPPKAAPAPATSPIAQQLADVAAEDRETHERANAAISKWSIWHSDKFEDADGGKKITLWVRDKSATTDVLMEAYRLPDAARGDYLKGPNGSHAIPQFNFVYGSDSLKTAIFDSNFQQYYKFNIDGSIDVRFTFHMKNGRTAERYLPAYLGVGGQPVFLKDESLALLDFVMTSDSMDVTVPGYDIDHNYTFDCSSFNAKSLINFQD
jgi:hypothetical protein